MSSVSGRQSIKYLMEKCSLSELSWPGELRKMKYSLHLVWRRETAPSYRCSAGFLRMRRAFDEENTDFFNSLFFKVELWLHRTVVYRMWC